MKKLLSLLLVCAMALVVLSGCAKDLEDIQEEGVLVMGTNAEFEPFEYLEGGKVVGFDPDVAAEIAKDMGVELEINDMDFDGLIAALTSGKVHVVLAGMSVTEERQKSVNFSDPYYTATQTIIVRKEGSTVSKAEDLEGKNIGVQQGTTGDLYVTENCNAKEVVGFKSGVEAGIELKNGKLDAVVIDKEPAQKIVEANPELMVLEEELTKEEYAIAVSKKAPKLLESINKTLERIKEDGTYMKLMETYLPEDAQALKDAEE